jgi:hypothetical protein
MKTWKSVDTHNVKNTELSDCMSALWDCYGTLPAPWNIIALSNGRLQLRVFPGVFIQSTQLKR